MKVVRIVKGSEVESYVGCNCINCKTKEAEVVILLGDQDGKKNYAISTTPLCYDCLWSLGDLIDQTTISDVD